MTREFCTYEQALALKELEFDEPCMSSRDMNNGEGLIQLPLYQQAFRFFREKHNLQAEMVFSEKPDRFYYYIGNMVTGDMDRGTDMSYEEAESACLDELIEIIKNK